MFLARAWEQGSRKQHHYRERTDLETWLGYTPSYLGLPGA